MQSSANTFGTFLQTFDTLGQQSNKVTVRPNAKNIYELIHTISSTPQPVPLKDLIGSSNWSKEDFLSILMEGKSEGFVEINEHQGEPIVSVTDLGKLFAP